MAEVLKIDSSSRKSSRRKSTDHLNKENYDIQFETPSELGHPYSRLDGANNSSNNNNQANGVGGVNTIFASVENHTKSSLKKQSAGSNANKLEKKINRPISVGEISLNEKIRNLENESKPSKGRGPGSLLLSKSNSSTPLNKQTYFVFKNERVGSNETQMYKIGKQDQLSGPQDFYFELRNSELNKYREIHTAVKEQIASMQKQDNMDESNDNDLEFEKSSAYNPITNPFSTFNEWSKLIQKQSISGDKLVDNNKERSQLVDVFKAILMLKERNWYEEIVHLFKVSRN